MLVLHEKIDSLIWHYLSNGRILKLPAAPKSLYILFLVCGIYKSVRLSISIYMQALLHSVPIGRLVVLDLFAEVKPLWNTSEQFFKVPYIWQVFSYCRLTFATEFYLFG